MRVINHLRKREMTWKNTRIRRKCIMRSFGETLCRKRKEKKISQSELAELMTKEGVPISGKSISKWEKGDVTPNIVQFFCLCRLLEIYEIYGDFIGENPSDPFRDLNEEGKDRAMEHIRLLTAAGYVRPEMMIHPTSGRKVIRQQAGIRDLQPVRKKIRLYHLPVSAGSGEFLDSDDYEEIDLESGITPDADFGVRISGNSMEPLFVSGQIIWIKQCEKIESGEIGIFSLDGTAYCKKLLNDANGTWLISLNPAYQPIHVGDFQDLKTFGRVVG